MRDAFTRAKVYQKAWQDYRRAEGAERRRAAAEARPAARRARRNPRRQAPRALPLVPRGRNPDDDPRRRRDGLQGRDVPARARGLQGRQGDGRARRRRSTFSDWWGYKIEAEDAIPGNAVLMTHKGVNVSINSDSAEARATAEHRSGQVGALGRHHRRPGARDGDDQPGASSCASTTASARSRSARTRTSPCGTHHPLSTLRDRRADLHRRHRLLRPRSRISSARRTSRPKSRCCSGARARTPAAAPETAEAPAATGRRARASHPEPAVDVPLNATGPALGDHQRAHRPGQRAGDREGHHRRSGQPDSGRRRQCFGAVGREGGRRAAAPASIPASSTAAPTSASTSRASATTTT